jgi:hypothetical protein
MRAYLVCVSLLALAGPARAEVPVAIGVNPPTSWLRTPSVGVSVYAGITTHQAIRVNVARYTFSPEVGYGSPSDRDLSNWFFVEGLFSGGNTDIGVGWMYFPRRLWSGPSLEAGVLRRARANYMFRDTDEPNIVNTESATYASRALVGWSWLIKKHVFISIAAGASVGYERGREETAEYEFDPSMTSDVARMRISAETLMRLGGAFSI